MPPRTPRGVNREISRAATPRPKTRGLEYTGRASQSAQFRSRMNTSFQTAMALQEAKEGDDLALLPYQPTPTINPGRPRTLAAGYDRQSRTMRVRFRDGTPWEYYEVTPQEWRNFQRVKSPGRAINRTFNNHPYARGNF